MVLLVSKGSQVGAELTGAEAVLAKSSMGVSMTGGQYPEE